MNSNYEWQKHQAKERLQTRHLEAEAHRLVKAGSREKAPFVKFEKSTSDTAVDGLLVGLMGGLAMAIFSAIAGLISGTDPSFTLGYFNLTRADSWLASSLANLAEAAIYGVLFALLLRLMSWLRPSLTRPKWAWGIIYGVVLWFGTTGVVMRTAASPLSQFAVWQVGAAHLLYGSVLGLRLQNIY